MTTPLLSIVIPAYNEVGRISATLADIARHLANADFEYEILVVNDGSRDATAALVREMCETIKYMTVIDSDENRGKGAAVRLGMLLARGKIRLFMDADNSTSIDQFETMRPHFAEGYAVVIGSRAVAGTQLDLPAPLYRQALGKIGNLLIQLLLVPGIWDTQCGFKAFTATAAEDLFRASVINGWGFDVELLALAGRLGYGVKEMPVRWVNDVHSKVGSAAYSSTLTEILKVRWWLWTKRYETVRGIAERTIGIPS
jgi:dolichyl-phosphate beta-glucosyltransferase